MHLQFTKSLSRDMKKKKINLHLIKLISDPIQLPAFGELLCHILQPNKTTNTSLAKITSKEQNEFIHDKLNGRCANIGRKLISMKPLDDIQFG